MKFAHAGRYLAQRLALAGTASWRLLCGVDDGMRDNYSEHREMALGGRRQK